MARRRNRDRGHRRGRPADTRRGGPRAHRPDSYRREIPLPRTTASLVARNLREANAGLLLQKYAATMHSQLKQEDQRAILAEIIRNARQVWDRMLWDRVLDRHRQFLREVGARSFTARLTSPLCLHLSTPISLENAGLALHPLWGVPYLPGTGLKGAARAFATRVWLPSQPDRRGAFETIERVFGRADSPWRFQFAGRLGVEVERKAQALAGGVVFFEAWPVRLHDLTIDILNNHHFEYYQDAQTAQTGYPPGDWEDPVPVFFPTVAKGAEFVFAVAPRREDVSEEDLELALEWLRGALQLEGAGAKTASGYGRFEIAETPRPGPSRTESCVVATYTLRLQSPGFFAGADQRSADSCDLRVPTLRGGLRWWWRTLHAGYITVKQLQWLETYLWGSTLAGSPVSFVIEPLDVPDPELFDRNSIIAQYQIPVVDPRTATGLHYITYGMDERTKGELRRRWYIPAPATWKLTVTAHPVTLAAQPGKSPVRLSALEVLREVENALWCLTSFGGLGSKARRGFGSFAVPPELSDLTLDTVIGNAVELRRRCQLPPRDYHEKKVQSPSFAAALLGDPSLKPAELPLGQEQLWPALNKLGETWRGFLRQISKDDRKAFGLPRAVRIPGESLFHPGPHVGKRHASPVWFHIFLRDDLYWARATFFPAAELPSLEQSRQLLARLRDYLVTQG